MTPLVDRALAALDEAFLDQVKEHYASVIARFAGGQELSSAIAQFRSGVTEAQSARDAAIKAIHDLMGAS